MTAKKTIVVVGGSDGGPEACARARQFDEHARIVLINDRPFLSHTHRSLSYYLAKSEDEIKARFRLDEQLFQKRFDVEIKNNTRALSLDIDARVVIIVENGVIERMRYDALIFAEGIESRKLDLNGLFGPRVVGFKTHDDMMSIKRALIKGITSALVVGGGSLGIDAALALKASGVHVRMIERKKRIMDSFSLQFAQTMLSRLQEEGIVINLGTTVVDAQIHDDDSFRITSSNHEIFDAELVVQCIGFTPKSTLLAHAGASMDVDGLIRVDDAMMTTLPQVFACGSVVSVPVAVLNQHRWIKEAAIVQRTAQIAGFNVSKDLHENFDHIKPVSGTKILRIKEKQFARTGLSESLAREVIGDDDLIITTAFGTSEEQEIFQPDMCVKLIVNRKTHAIVGGEVFGTSWVRRSIDILALAVLEGFSLDRLLDIDLAYHGDAGPAFDPLKDAVLRTRNALLKKSRIISAETLALWLTNNQDFRLVDVSDAPKLSGRLVKKVMHLPFQSLRDRFHELAQANSPIVLYSQSGHQSYLAERALTQRGIDNVYHLDGGVSMWDLIGLKE